MRLDLREIIEVPGGSVPFETELATELHVSIVPAATRFVLPEGVVCLSSCKNVAAEEVTEQDENATV